MSGGTRGRLIALEGIDGCGKTTQARSLADHLGAGFTFEPGGTPLGASLRTLLLNPTGPSVGERAEALLMASDRAQHVAEVLEPELVAGRWMVTDRFSASTLAYQGFGRGMGIDELVRLVEWATAGLNPDLNVLVDVPVATAAARRSGERADVFEQLGDGFQQRVADGFRQMASEDPNRWAVVDGDRPIAEVAAEVQSVVRDRVGEPTRG